MAYWKRFVERSSGEIWVCTGFIVKSGVKLYFMKKYDDYVKNDESLPLEMTEEERASRFEYKDCENPSYVVSLKTVGLKRVKQLFIHCPECRSVLKVKGGPILTSPVKYEHVCSNEDCTYETCLPYVYSGMYITTTDEGEKNILPWLKNE